MSETYPPNSNIHHRFFLSPFSNDLNSTDTGDFALAPNSEVGLTDTGETWGVVSRSAHSFQFVGNVDDDGVAYLNIDYYAAFGGYWTGAGGRTYSSFASNDLHTIACFR